jgi:serine incorporator 1/3
MGGVISGLATSLVTQSACCFGSAALNCCCNLCGSTSSTATRVGYALQFLATACLSYFVMTDWAEKKLAEITYGYLKFECQGGSCYGVLAVYRLCLATSLFGESSSTSPLKSTFLTF